MTCVAPKDYQCKRGEATLTATKTVANDENAIGYNIATYSTSKTGTELNTNSEPAPNDNIVLVAIGAGGGALLLITAAAFGCFIKRRKKSQQVGQ